MRLSNCVAGLALTLASLTACGGESDQLDTGELEDALITVENLGSDFKLDDSHDDDEDESLGCLDEIEQKDSDGKEADRAFALDDDFGLPGVLEGLKSYDSEGDAEEALDDLTESVDGCESIKETDDEGSTVDLELEHDTNRTADGVDQQLTIDATGTVGGDGLELPFSLAYRVARVENNLVAIAFFNFSGIEDEPDELLEAAIERLEAVIDGDDLPEPEALLSDYTAEPDEETEEPDPTVTQPLDGGSYTWESGVSMTLTVTRVEPWGRKSDFCGDGSCGVANAADTRLVLKYEVTVPDAAEPFDPSSCPGELHIASGNDDEAFGGVAGEYDSSIDGTMLPGTTKFGTDEYYIEKPFVREEFYVESSCGETDFDGETVFFRGTIPASRG